LDKRLILGHLVLNNQPQAANYLLGLIYNQEKPQPLIIDNRNVSVSYAHMNSFVPVYAPTQWVTLSALDANGATAYLVYWDEKAYATHHPPLLILSNPAAAAGIAAANPMATISAAPVIDTFGNS
jgi:hypothetical protein